jgi:hypothetical protein
MTIRTKRQRDAVLTIAAFVFLLAILTGAL